MDKDHTFQCCQITSFQKHQSSVFLCFKYNFWIISNKGKSSPEITSFHLNWPILVSFFPSSRRKVSKYLYYHRTKRKWPPDLCPKPYSFAVSRAVPSAARSKWPAPWIQCRCVLHSSVTENIGIKMRMKSLCWTYHNTKGFEEFEVNSMEPVQRTEDLGRAASFLNKNWMIMYVIRTQQTNKEAIPCTGEVKPRMYCKLLLC